ncbi:laminin G domain protein [Dictyocaulus viviparus]|uniref:Laminin G domain protein n=1 Tax=Dictyocaulus viviparus TaxID=29172 RepID=A0A0D8Y307_DICVI|nr:laminin G domain protein [Dictyocaulus viviparus]
MRRHFASSCVLFSPKKPMNAVAGIITYCSRMESAALEKDTASLSFNGSNYAEFPVSDSTYLETNITIEFRTSENRNGILFFAGQFNADDYISIAIIGPNVVSRHNCGEGTIEEMFRGPFTLDQWHTITVWRKFCDRTLLKIDSQPLMVDLTEQFRFYKGISMDKGMFIGGTPHINGIESKIGTSSGFLGCIRKLIINDAVLLDTENEINTAVNLQDLEYCSPITQAISATQPEIREIDLSTGMLYQHGTVDAIYICKFCTDFYIFLSAFLN